MTQSMYTLPEVLERLSVSKTTLYALLRRGDLSRVKLGRRTYVPATDLAIYLEGHSVVPQAQAGVVRHSTTCSYLVFHNRSCDCSADPG